MNSLVGRDIYVVDQYDGRLIGPQETNNGLKQGSLLCTTLLNINSSSLFECACEDIDIIQFVDDLRDSDQMMNKINIMVFLIRSLLVGNSLLNKK